MKADPRPIFILGIMPRCGTNFLSNLLLLHPDCAAPDPVWEDFLVTHLDLLARYSDTVAGRWDESWGAGSETRAHLDESIGQGLTAFLVKLSGGKRAVSKTPFVDNLDLFFRFFPGSKLLVLVRDGRSVVESSVRSFGWRREAALHAIAGAARTIRLFRQARPNLDEQVHMVRYEDLWQHPQTALGELFSFLDLEMENYDLEQALRLPVRGSSDLKTGGKADIHWDPVERTDDFDPLSRFGDWDDDMHYRYNQVAGEEMEALGYPCKNISDPAGRFRLKGLFLDALWGLKSLFRSLYNRLIRP